jgi:hypothetical protein
MSEYILLLLLIALCAMFWRARSGLTFDELLDTGHHHHVQVLATNTAHPKGGTWAEHQGWMAE